MLREPRIDPAFGEPLPDPPPELRERVLRRCRQAMSERCQADRRRQSRWRWRLAGGVACLLLLNALTERQSDARIAGIVQGRSPVLVASRAARSHGRLLFARVTLLAALLRDPDSL